LKSPPLAQTFCRVKAMSSLPFLPLCGLGTAHPHCGLGTHATTARK
jgi:hypothetical protein